MVDSKRQAIQTNQTIITQPQSLSRSTCMLKAFYFGGVLFIDLPDRGVAHQNVYQRFGRF